MESWLKGIVDEKGVEQIRLAVQAAESRTSCEIVPMIVRGSTPTVHTPLILFLVLLVLFSAALPLVPQGDSPLWLWEICALILAWVFAQILSKVDRVHRLLMPSEDLRLSVDRRATHEFYLGNVTQTAGKNGVLVFVSLLEKRAVVLTDSAVASKLPQGTWDGAVTKLIEKTKAGDFAGGMSAAIHDLGAKLSEIFPHEAGDKNELSDLLVVKH